MVEGKICRGSSAKYHQSIAALLAFSRIQKSRHENNSNAYPMLIISPTDVVILIYQPDTDTLIISQILPWEKLTYFFVWAVLHHVIFPIKLPVSYECGYKKVIQTFPGQDFWYLESRSVLQKNCGSLTSHFEYSFLPEGLIRTSS